jgi:ABC-type glycerol-3-phosphate transport system permease component
MYVLLVVGGVSMAYPFLLMLTMATTGRGDFREFRLAPRYWTSDAALFKKYLLDLVPMNRPAWWPHDDIPATQLAPWFGKDHWYGPADMREEDFAETMNLPPVHRAARAGDMRQFLAHVCPGEFKQPLGLYDRDCALALQDDYYAWLRRKYGSLDAVNRLYPDNASRWEDLGVVVEPYYRWPGDSPRERDWREFIETRPPERTGLVNADLDVYYYLRGRDLPPDYPGERDAKGNVVRTRITYDDLYTGKLGPEYKERFLRSYAVGRYLQVDTALAGEAWREFLSKQQKDPAMPLPARLPVESTMAGLWGRFVQTNGPLAAIRLLRPEDSWRAFLGERYGTVDRLNAAYGTRYASLAEVRLPWAAFLYDSFLGRKRELRWTYLWHNFKTVFDFVTVHGSALKVTVTYIVLMILGTLTVNPLAAYAMSRFRLQETHHVLIFLLATMAFPGEVLMIPGFLLIKRFPWLPILIIVFCALGFYLLVRRLGRRLPFLLSATLALAITLALVAVGLPWLSRRFHVALSVSLMNTFWALILPGLANGYGVFLLKGFFDSLPPELYEAGLIDGASELRMFWQITLPLCKPILAVMALGAFTGAYGAFMHAFLICQDPKMWTFMVFLYEFQQLHTLPMVMASLVVAAVPTLLVFIFCQNMILRGIVIPSFK